MAETKLNIHEAKTHLSHHLAKLKENETIIICRRNVPIAELKKLPSPHKGKKRPLGLSKGRFVVSKEFFDPLPKDILAAFEGKGDHK